MTASTAPVPAASAASAVKVGAYDLMAARLAAVRSLPGHTVTGVAAKVVPPSRTVVTYTAVDETGSSVVAFL